MISKMSRLVALAVLNLLVTAMAINRSVYKVVLTQKGFTQFVQYDVETPPIREFTFCTWIRIYDVENDQSIFNYIVNGNNRVVRLWLDSGGKHIMVSFNKHVTSSVPVDIARDVWRHICLSYQSDFGAWALYLDSRLVSCEASQSLYGFVIPAGGSVIIGYGTSDNGSPAGLEGEVFGVNMILSSTIERNFTMKNHPQYMQKPFRKNKIRGLQNIDYVILKDLQTDEIHNVVGGTALPPFINKSKSFIKVQTPTSFIEHDVGIQLTSTKPKFSDSSNEKEIFDIVMDHNQNSVNTKPPVTFWNLVNEAGQTGKFRAPVSKRPEQTSSETQDRNMISEYETPPPISSTRHDYMEKNLEVEKPPLSESIYKINEVPSLSTNKILPTRYKTAEISDVEVPPPPETSKVYNQWTSSKYAGSVLNYLKSINFYNKEKRVPTTIPLMKVSDSFPYPSELKANVVRPPSNLQRKKIISEKRFHSHYMQPSSLKRLHIQKRNIKPQEINVMILEDDFRTEILKSHAKTQPRDVEITNRGETKKRIDNRLYRSTENFSGENENDKRHRTSRFTPSTSYNSDQVSHFDFHKTNSLFNVLPFLKSVEYFTGENESIEGNKEVNANEMYTKSFSNANKWHNIKSYNNDYTPRRSPSFENGQANMDQKIAEANRRHPSIRLKYKPESNKVVPDNKEEAILKGRELAMDVSNQSNHNSDAISILKYNHGFLPGHHKKSKSVHKDEMKFIPKLNNINGKNNFDKHVKIGNALNERHIIGVNQEQNKQSFVGGDEKVPDIHRYRSEIDNETENIPSSLKPRACKNVELFDNILYVQPDGSIDMSHILSPLKIKNVGIEFVVQNYQKCSLEDSGLDKNYLLLINWIKTPVRLFGGASPRKTKDLCGFF